MADGANLAVIIPHHKNRDGSPLPERNTPTPYRSLILIDIQYNPLGTPTEDKPSPHSTVAHRLPFVPMSI